MRKIFGLGGASVLVFWASPAFALDTGQCLPAAQVRAALAAEHMNPIIVGNRTGYGWPTALIFTANADGSRGYLIRADKPLGELAEIACVESTYRDVKLHDVSLTGIPTWARMGDNAARAEAICKRDHLGFQEKCASHDASVIALNRAGQRVIFMATGTAINPRDKSIRSNQRLWLTSEGASGRGLLSAATEEGADYILSAYTKGSLTQHGAALLDKSPG